MPTGSLTTATRGAKMTLDKQRPPRCSRPLRGRLARRDEGFTVIEILVALALFTVISLFVVQAFVSGMGYSKQANERAAATTLGMQIMEQIRASPNPYTMVGFTPLTRQTCCPLASPWTNINNPTPYSFQVSIDVVRNPDLVLSTVTVSVFRAVDVNPFVTFTTILKDL